MVNLLTGRQNACILHTVTRLLFYCKGATMPTRFWIWVRFSIWLAFWIWAIFFVAISILKPPMVWPEIISRLFFYSLCFILPAYALAFTTVRRYEAKHSVYSVNKKEADPQDG